MKPKSVVFHPLLFAIYPILELAFNLNAKLPFRYAGRALVLAPLCALGLMIVLKYVIKDWDRAGFLTSLVLFLLLYYGILYRVGWGLSIGKLRLGRHPFLFTGWALLLGLIGSRWTWKHLHNHSKITQFLNFAAVVAIVLSVGRFGLNRAMLNASRQERNTAGEQIQPELPKVRATEKPDIYYIIVDGYGRRDVLQEVYDFDNTPFIEFLQSHGFYVAEQSQANYTATLYSLPAALNFEYLDTLLNMAPNSRDYVPLVQLLQHSRARAALQALGYQFIANDTNFIFSTIVDADILFRRPPDNPWLNEFEAVLVMSSAAAVLVDAGVFDVPWIGYQQARERILFSYDSLQHIPEIPGPKFVFFHILAPHPPFLFDATGQPVSPGTPYSGGGDGDHYLGFPDAYVQGYRGQLAYTNILLQQTVETILSNSETPPIIVIQGDHGPGALLEETLEQSCIRERVGILNAYYLPGEGAQKLYPTITPVNTFRVIFDTYFGTNLGLLADHSYYVNQSHPYDFTEIGDRSQIPCNLEPIRRWE